MTRSGALLTLALVLFPAIAPAQSLVPGKVQLEERKSGKTGKEFYVIALTGALAYPLAREFDELVESFKDDRPLLVHLNSGGGSYQEGLKIIATLRRLAQEGREVNTTVHNGEICGSMCVPVFLQGRKRFAGEVAAFMFHGVVAHGFTNVPNEAKTREALNLFLDAGVSKEWLDGMWGKKVFSLPGQYWMTAGELHRENSGIVTEIIPRHEVFEPWSAPIDPQIRPR